MFSLQSSAAVTDKGSCVLLPDWCPAVHLPPAQLKWELATLLSLLPGFLLSINLADLVLHPPSLAFKGQDTNFCCSKLENKHVQQRSFKAPWKEEVPPLARDECVPTFLTVERQVYTKTQTYAL